MRWDVVIFKEGRWRGKLNANKPQGNNSGNQVSLAGFEVTHGT